MKPVAIFRHFPTEGPGYFATFLEANGVPLPAPAGIFPRYVDPEEDKKV